MNPALENGSDDHDPGSSRLSYTARRNLIVDAKRRQRTQRGLAARPEAALGTGDRFKPLRQLGTWALPTAVDLVYFADSTDECATDWPYDKMADRHGAGLTLSGEEMVHRVLQVMRECNPTWFETNVEHPFAGRRLTQGVSLHDLETRPNIGARDTGVDPEDLNRMSAELGAQLARSTQDLKAAALLHDNPPPRDKLDKTQRALLARFRQPIDTDGSSWADACRVASAVAAQLAAADEPEQRIFLIDAGLSREYDQIDYEVYGVGRRRGLLQHAIHSVVPDRVPAGPQFSNLVARALECALASIRDASVDTASPKQEHHEREPHV